MSSDEALAQKNSRHWRSVGSPTRFKPPGRHLDLYIQSVQEVADRRARSRAARRAPGSPPGLCAGSSSPCRTTAAAPWSRAAGWTAGRAPAPAKC